MAIGREGNVKWVDGIRGFASILVLLTHITRAFDGDLFRPVSTEDAAPRLLQLPFLRVLIQGRLGVTIFALVTGYVCALKPIKLCQQGNQPAAFAAMAKSALRRVPRLVLPSALATILIWVLSQFGAFRVAKQCDSWWLGATSPDQTPMSLVDAAKDLVHNLATTWIVGMNSYDGNQWTMLPLLKASMLVYTFMVATSFIKQRYRMLLSMVMLYYYFISSDPTFGIQVFWGIFLADLQNNESAAAFLIERRRVCRILSAALIFSGLALASYPEDKPEWAAWSRAQQALLTPLLPDHADIPRFASALGLDLIALGLHFSPWARELLAHRVLLWFGRQSFAVYLLHGLLLRTVLCWAVYGVRLPAPVQDDEGNWQPGPALQFPGMPWLFCCLVIWVPLNYAVAMLWTTHVDPWCARVTERLVGGMAAEQEEKPKLLLPV